MAGYINRTIKLDFTDEWSNDPDNDPIWIVIKNPRLVPSKELQSDIDVDADGKPVDQAAAVEAMNATVARLVKAWRVYDATADVDIDPITGEEIGESTLLPLPATPELVRKLPMAFVTRVAQEITAAVNPQ